MDNLNFTWFTKTKSRLSDPRISISKNNFFGFNAALVRQYKLDHYPYVLLGWDKPQNAIGFCFKKTKEVGALNIRFTNSESKSGTINTKNFFTFNEINNTTNEKIIGRHVVQEIKKTNDEIILAIRLPK